MNEYRTPVASPTEQRNPRTTDIDLVPTLTLVTLINDEDLTVPDVVRAVLPELAKLVDAAAERISRGGHVRYFGAGTSGRLGYLDAAELLPTFGVPADLVVAHHAGGDAALMLAVEDAEDDLDAGAKDAGALRAVDVAIGLAASGYTPYVGSALQQAKVRGALTALITANPSAPLSSVADHVLVADTGAEAIAGSTRLKAGTAQKLILNTFSTALMVHLGHTFSNLMVDLQATNGKLRGRAVTLLAQATGLPEQQCEAALEMCGDLKTALLYLLADKSLDASAQLCRDALMAADGRVRPALLALNGTISVQGGTA